jgi:hypothetical protein
MGSQYLQHHHATAEASAWSWGHPDTTQHSHSDPMSTGLVGTPSIAEYISPPPITGIEDCILPASKFVMLA